MTTRVFLTIDTEFAWRHHAAGLDMNGIYARSLEPAGVGIAYQLERLAAHGLHACFFVDPMPALVWGIDPIRRLVGAILDAGQEVQLHLHPNWTGARADDGGAGYARFQLVEYTAAEQRDLLARARDLLVAAGAPTPVAFRAGSYAANDETLAELARLGFAYDSSHNGAEHPFPSNIGLPPERVAPVARAGLVEVPVSTIAEPGGRLRTFQICALSAAEIRAALAHAVAERHAAVTIVNHSFELASRHGTRANAVHVRRFEALCAALAAHRDVLPTTRFDARPALPLGRDDRPLPTSRWRTNRRRVEQAWSNLVEERVA